MDPVHISAQFDRLSEAAAQRAEDVVRREVRGVVQDLRAELRRLLEEEPRGSPKRRRVRCRADSRASSDEVANAVATATPTTACAEAPPPALGTFGASLRQPSVSVRVGGETLHIHRGILESLPYFERLMQGEWRDAAAPEVELPCSATEFGLLLQRLYTGETLGSPGVPIKDFASALRIAEAAAMLLVEDRLPELPALLRALVLTPEDGAAAAAAAEMLPGVLGQALRGLSSSAVPGVGAQLIEAAARATTPAARDVTSALLASHRCQVDKEVLAETAAKALFTYEKADAEWGTRLAYEHCNCSQATALFRSSPLAELHTACSKKGSGEGYGEVVHQAFLAHLHRCAGVKGALVEALTLGVDGAREIPESGTHKFFDSGRFSARCCFTHCDPLRLGQASADGLAAALAAAGRELEAVTEIFLRMPPSQLAQILSDSVLAALGPHAPPVVAQLAASEELIDWAKPARISILPQATRITVCMALLPNLSNLDQDVIAEVGRALR